MNRKELTEVILWIGAFVVAYRKASEDGKFTFDDLSRIESLTVLSTAQEAFTGLSQIKDELKALPISELNELFADVRDEVNYDEDPKVESVIRIVQGIVMSSSGIVGLTESKPVSDRESAKAIIRSIAA